MRQQGREQQALARRRVAERDRAEYQAAQRRGAQQRRNRRVRLHDAAFGPASLFAGAVEAFPAEGSIVPVAPSEIGIAAMNQLSRGSWETVRHVPLCGIRNLGETCYLSCVAQVLIRTPAMLEWLKQHVADGCRSGQEGLLLCPVQPEADLRSDAGWYNRPCPFAARHSAKEDDGGARVPLWSA